MSCRDAVVVVCGSGIGGAVIKDRKVVKGVHHMAGEFSYQLTTAEEPYGERRMFGFSSGIASLIELASSKMDMPREELDGEVIFRDASNGNRQAIEAVREYARRIAVQITNYQFILDPERIAVGGGISIQPLFLKLLKEELVKINRLYEKWQIPMPEVVACRYYNDSNLIGALYVHLSTVDEGVVLENKERE